MTWDGIEKAVNTWLDAEEAQEIRYALAVRLRPQSGFEDYHYALDKEFVERIDSDWATLWHITERPTIKQEIQRPVNL